MGFLSGLLEKRSVSVVPNESWRHGGMSLAAASGVAVSPQSALKYSAVFGAVRILAESIAMLPLPLYERLANGGKRRATKHPLYGILHDIANPEMSAFELRETAMGHVTTWGNGYMEIEWSRSGYPVALWPLLPNRTWAQRIDGRLVYRVDVPGYESDYLPASHVLHIRGLGFNGLVGYSPIGMARQAIGLGLAAEEYGSRFFSNDARPGGVLEHPGEMSEPAYKRLKDSWSENHEGLSKSHRTAILEEGTKFHEIGLPPEEAQFLETRKFQISEIARMYRVPPHMLADLDNATFSNIEHQSLSFVTHTLGPWIVRWEQAIKRSLLLPSERAKIFAEFLVAGLLRGDITSRYAAYAQGRQNGWLSANDIRRMENLDPIEDGGDVYLVPLNMVPANSVGSGLRELNGLGGAQQIGMRELRSGKQIVGARQNLVAAHLPVLVDALARVLRREANDVGNAFERWLAGGELAFWGEVSGFYEGHQVWMMRYLLPALASLATLVGQAAADELNGEADDLDVWVQAYAARYIARHIGKSRQQLEQVIEEADEEARQERLKEMLRQWREERAQSVARDEGVRFGNAVAKTIYLALGVTKIRWVASGDTCPFCKGLGGKVIGIQSNFLTAGEDYEPDGAQIPLRPGRNVGHPPAHRGCDCGIVAER